MANLSANFSTEQWGDIQFPGLVTRESVDPDKRTNYEVMNALQAHSPVTSQKNVWAIWDGGLDQMPAWCQRNVIDWVRRLGPSWTVRVVDLVHGSPNNVFSFLSTKDLPKGFSEVCFNAKKQHVSDIVRLALLYQYGGVYMDVSILLFRSLDDICWAALEDPALPYTVALFEYQSRKHFGQIINNFIACVRGDAFIKHCEQRCNLKCERILTPAGHQIFCRVWQDVPTLNGSHNHVLLRHLGLMQPDDPGFGDDADFTEFTDYCAQMMAFERLRLLEEPGPAGFNGAKYFQEHMFLLSSWKEQFYGQDRLNGEEMYQLLSLDFKPEDSTNMLQRQAKDFIVGLLSTSSIAKFGEGYWQPGMPLPLPTLWKEDPGSDCKPGTWAAYLRWGSVNLEQTRRRATYLEPIKIPDEKDTIYRVGVLEPVDVQHTPQDISKI